MSSYQHLTQCHSLTESDGMGKVLILLTGHVSVYFCCVNIGMRVPVCLIACACVCVSKVYTLFTRAGSSEVFYY